MHLKSVLFILLGLPLYANSQIVGTIDTSSINPATSIQVDNGYIIAGYEAIYDTVINDWIATPVLTKIDFQGNVNWTSRYPRRCTEGFALPDLLKLKNSNNFLFAFNANNDIPFGYQTLYLYKYDENGAILDSNSFVSQNGSGLVEILEIYYSGDTICINDKEHDGFGGFLEGYTQIDSNLTLLGNLPILD